MYIRMKPEGEYVYSSYTLNRRGASNIYADSAFICSYVGIEKWCHCSFAVIGLSTLSKFKERK